jgi:hypothetical protein
MWLLSTCTDPYSPRMRPHDLMLLSHWALFYLIDCWLLAYECDGCAKDRGRGLSEQTTKRFKIYYEHDHIVVMKGTRQHRTAIQVSTKGMTFSKSQGQIPLALGGGIRPKVPSPPGSAAMSPESPRPTGNQEVRAIRAPILGQTTNIVILRYPSDCITELTASFEALTTWTNHRRMITSRVRYL